MDRFPPELLAESFYWYVLEVYQSHSRWSSNLCTPYCWIVIRHVCRAWRNVALTFPKLSTLITLTRAECVQDLLDRSGSLLLYVRAKPYSYITSAATLSHMSAANKLIQQHLERVVHADVYLYPVPVFYVGGTDDTNPVLHALPNLRSLELIQHYFSEDGTPAFQQFTFPNLEELTMSVRSLLVGSRVITSSLRRLSVGEFSTSITPEEIASYLKPLLRLEVLVIQDLWSSADEDGAFPTPRRRISLPRLRHLFLQCHRFETGLQLLRLLLCPPSATTTLHYSTMSFSSSSSRLISAVVSLFQDKIGYSSGQGDTSVIRSVMLQFGYDTYSDRTADFWLVRTRMNPIARKGEPSGWPNLEQYQQRADDFETLDLDLQHSFPAFQFSTTNRLDNEGFLLSLLRQLPMSSVESVRLMDVGWVPRHLGANWKAVFASMVNVEELFVKYVVGIDSAYWDSSGDSDPQTSSLFPCVASVTLEKTLVSQVNRDVPAYHTFRLEHLAECLVARRLQAMEPGGSVLGHTMFSLESSIVTLGYHKRLELADLARGVVGGGETSPHPGHGATGNKRLLSIRNWIARSFHMASRGTI